MRFLTIGKVSSDNHGLRYHNGITTSSNIVFVKSSPPTTELPIPTIKLLKEVKGRSVKHYTSCFHGNN